MKQILLDLIDECFLREFEKATEEKDECRYAKRLNEKEEALFAELTEHQIEKVKQLENAVRNQMDYIRFESQKYLLNYAFRLGMDMQKAFDQDDYEWMTGARPACIDGNTYV